jgi:hypothetical protein
MGIQNVDRKGEVTLVTATKWQASQSDNKSCKDKQSISIPVVWNGNIADKVERLD